MHLKLENQGQNIDWSHLLLDLHSAGHMLQVTTSSCRASCTAHLLSSACKTGCCTSSSLGSSSLLFFNPEVEIYPEKELQCICMHMRQQLILFSEFCDELHVLINWLAARRCDVAESFSWTTLAKEVATRASTI
jgi:hypothetical protein